VAAPVRASALPPWMLVIGALAVVAIVALLVVLLGR
jgi:hypothetical protein